MFFSELCLGDLVESDQFSTSRLVNIIVDIIIFNHESTNNDTMLCLD